MKGDPEALSGAVGDFEGRSGQLDVGIAPGAMWTLSEFCEAEWVFDTEFDAMCTLRPRHDGRHRACVVGNNDVPAEITWENA